MANIKPYDAATQQRVIKERLHALDLINERFGRSFRSSLFNLLRRVSDVTVSSVNYHSARDFYASTQQAMTYNLVSMKPLRGNALLSFPSELIFMVVENLFGGDGRFNSHIENRDFSLTEQRIILRLLKLAMDAYATAWRSVYPIDLEFIRTETQAKFTNITNSPNDTLVTTHFDLEVGSFASRFSISLPYAMLEPIKSKLNNVSNDRYSDDPGEWNQKMSAEIRESGIELVTDFVYIDTSLSALLSLKVGDVLPVELPELVTTRVHGVPVMRCEYGSQNDVMALRVKELIDHALLNQKPSGQFVTATPGEAKDI